MWRHTVGLMSQQVKKIIEKNLEFAHGKNHSEFYYIKQLGNLPFELRPKWHCYKGVKLFKDGQKELSKKRRSKVYNNEAQILGTLHRSKAVHPKKYKKELAKTKQKEWIKAARHVGKKMKQDYQNLTKTLKQ